MRRLDAWGTGFPVLLAAALLRVRFACRRGRRQRGHVGDTGCCGNASCREHSRNTAGGRSRRLAQGPSRACARGARCIAAELSRPRNPDLGDRARRRSGGAEQRDRRCGDRPAGLAGRDTLRRNSERALAREKPAPETVVEAFGESQPQTFEGAMLLARRPARGRHAMPRMHCWRPSGAPRSWTAPRKPRYSPSSARCSPLPTTGRAWSSMLYADRVSSADAVAGPAGRDGTFDAWSAVIRDGKDAGRLLDAVPEGAARGRLSLRQAAHAAAADRPTRRRRSCCWRRRAAAR